MRVVDLKIEDIAFGGKGVGREQGKAIFVPYTIDGELVSAEVVREKKQFAEGVLVDVKESAPDRVRPECPYFSRCGGCAYQHMGYEHQLAIKWLQVRNILQRIGKLTNIPMRPIIPSPKQYKYRNRITVHVRDGVIGFFLARFTPLDRYRALPDLVRRSESRLSGSARTRPARWALHVAGVLQRSRFFSNQQRSLRCTAGFDCRPRSAESESSNRRLLRCGVFRQGIAQQV